MVMLTSGIKISNLTYVSFVIEASPSSIVNLRELIFFIRDQSITSELNLKCTNVCTLPSSYLKPVFSVNHALLLKMN